MKVLLISVPAVRIRYNISGVYPLPPLGLAYIASVLEREGFDVDILDLDAISLNQQQLITRIQKSNYSVIGLSCRSIFSFGNLIPLSHLIKQHCPDSFIVVGGPGIAFSPETMLKELPDCDVVVDGEGEDIFAALCNKVNNQELDFLDIQSISYRHKETIVSNKRNSFCDMESLPFPARHLLPNHAYRLHPPFGIQSPITLIETSRGCVYNCSFCSLQRPFKERSVMNVVDEITHVESVYGVKEVHFVDPIFTYNQQRVTDICKALIEKKSGIVWSCKTRVDLVSKSLLELMAKAGCYIISYGVESGSQEILDKLHKDTTVPMIKDVFKWTKACRIKTLAYVMIGAEGETEESVDATIALVKEIEPNFVLYGELMPDPKANLVKQKEETDPELLQKLFDLYVFRKSPYEEKNINGIPKKDIKRWVLKAYKSFYLSPRYIFKSLCSFSNLKEFVNLFKGAYFLLMDFFRRKVF